MIKTNTDKRYVEELQKQIAIEYQTTDVSLVRLAYKYETTITSIQRWVKKFPVPKESK